MTRRPEPERIGSLRQIMRERNIRTLLVTQRENVRYLTGFTGSAGSLIVSAGKPVLLTDFRYKTQAAAEAAGVRIHIQKKDWATAVRDALDGRGRAQLLWFDEQSVTVERAKLLRKQGLELRESKDPVAELRTIKDRIERTALRLAIRRAEESFRELKRSIRPGAAERDLALKLEMLMREKGARRSAFDIIVASGKNGSMPHASVTNRRLRPGDLVTIDFGAEADGYVCDITRTVCVGKPSVRQRAIHALVLRAQQAGIDAVRPGAACAAIDKAARDVIAAAGHGRHFGHSTGHGVGLMVHEAPTVSALSKATVSEGTVFTVEPGVYIPGWGGVRIEDMVLVTGRGAELLTTLPREL